MVVGDHDDRPLLLMGDLAEKLHHLAPRWLSKAAVGNQVQDFSILYAGTPA